MLKFLVSRMFSRYVIIRSQVDQFVDIFPVNVIASSQKDCVDRDLRPQFQTFHTVISGDHILHDLGMAGLEQIGRAHV